MMAHRKNHRGTIARTDGLIATSATRSKPSLKIFQTAQQTTHYEARTTPAFLGSEKGDRF